MFPVCGLHNIPSLHSGQHFPGWYTGLTQGGGAQSATRQRAMPSLSQVHCSHSDGWNTQGDAVLETFHHVLLRYRHKSYRMVLGKGAPFTSSLLHNHYLSSTDRFSFKPKKSLGLHLVLQRGGGGIRL